MLRQFELSKRDRIGVALRDDRLFILIELLLIILWVGLHLQLTTILLLLLGWLSLWLRRQGWRDLGLKRPYLASSSPFYTWLLDGICGCRSSHMAW